MSYLCLSLREPSQSLTRNGPLQIWIDGGYSDTQKDRLIELLQTYQSGASVFNGCDTDGTCVSESSVRWIGNEEGDAPEENWST